MAVANPVIGNWYRRTNGTIFEVVAVDEQDATVELQYFDGTLDEVELDTWPTMLIERAGAPEDWSGSVDMDPEDFSGSETGEIPQGYYDPLSFLDRTE
jgi:hypothetical protein